MSNPDNFKFHQIYQMPGEGLIVEFRCGNETHLYGLDGLQFRLLERRSAGKNTKEEEKALAILNNLSVNK